MSAAPGPRSVKSLCDLAQRISFGTSDDVHSLERDGRKSSRSVVNDESDRLRAFIVLGALRSFSTLPGSIGISWGREPQAECGSWQGS